MNFELLLAFYLTEKNNFELHLSGDGLASNLYGNSEFEISNMEFSKMNVEFFMYSRQNGQTFREPINLQMLHQTE